MLHIFINKALMIMSQQHNDLLIHSFIHSQFISVNLLYKDMENVMFIILGVTKHIYKENNNYKQ